MRSSSELGSSPCAFERWCVDRPRDCISAHAACFAAHLFDPLICHFPDFLFLVDREFSFVDVIEIIYSIKRSFLFHCSISAHLLSIISALGNISYTFSLS